MCNPEMCPRAKGHFDRVNDAVYEILHQEFGITRSVILEYAEKFQVCPFEFCLDISSFVDGIICDYNYVFDPDVRLKRYFADGAEGDYFFLMDEAHNLVSRAREMYSASIIKEEVLLTKKVLGHRAPALGRQLTRLNKALLEMKRECGGYQRAQGCRTSGFSVKQCFWRNGKVSGKAGRGRWTGHDSGFLFFGATFFKYV